MKKPITKELILTALFTTIIAISAQISFPIGPIPITMQTFAVGLSATLLGKKWGTLSTIIYLLMGLILPVYAGGAMGIHNLFGPTGGYLISFPFMALLIGFCTSTKKATLTSFVLFNCLGNFLVLAIGTLWLKIYSGITWETAFFSGVFPFIAGGVIKSIAVSIFSIALLKAIPEKHRLNLS